ncbi:hypothetical protein [Methylomicrobium lacus]|uniref:hypothetical protein n=1 Tax=Methylomicrobium lacus TaxID=136992 RepID=UPI0035A990A2
MTKQTFKYLGIPAFMLVAAGFAPAASAHTQTGSLGAAAGTIDFYLVTCTTGDSAGARLEVSVINQSASSPLLSVQIQKDDLAINSTDTAGGNAQYSPTVPLTGGDGVYYLTIDKSGAGSINYSLEYHCKTGGGLHTGDDTSIVRLQDEGIQLPPPTDPGTDPDPNPEPNPPQSLPPTDVKDQAVESKTHYTGLAITHGCQDDEQKWRLFPVRVVSAVFPNDVGALAYKVDPDTGTETSVNLADHIEGAIGGLPTLAPEMVQDKSVFKKQKEVVGENDKVRALQFYLGKLDVAAEAVLPFRVSAPKFLADSCAKSLRVRIAVGNWCEHSKADPNRADIWMGQKTSLFNDSTVMPGDGYWPTLVINRNLVANPLANGCGNGFDLAVQPSKADIDRFLPVKGYWPANR